MNDGRATNFVSRLDIDHFSNLVLLEGVFEKYFVTNIPKIFLDCDGVLADFDHLAAEMFGMPGQEFEDLYGSETFWNEIRNYPGGFFNSLPLMRDAMTLWDAVKHHKPTILTGAPAGGWAKPQKLAWRNQHFPKVEMIVCRAKDKYLHMHAPGDILVDDFIKHRHVWEGNGGIFIHHTDIRDTLQALEQHGVDIRL